ncbi:MAG: ABC transporter substrate-binding protein [Proteobacteria bacterium]|nr:ABC transporter substrate-binding protein [Pseudomonadota bacterium]
MNPGRRGVLAGMAMAMAAPAIGRAQSREAIDSVGRRIRIAGRPQRVVAAGPPASLLLYALAPDALVGWVPALPDAAKPYLLPAVRRLPATARLTGRGGAPDLEALKALRPDLIVDFGSTADRYVGLARNVQAATGIPYALIDGSLDKSPAALRLAAAMLGRHERGEALAAYAQETLSRVDAATKAAPSASRPRVYLARGADGAQTPPGGSDLAEIIERAGALNVAAGGSGRGSGSRISVEQIRDWNPDLIIAFDRAIFEAIRTRPEWRFARRIVAAPGLPWNWLGEPPSIQRLIGLRWLAALFHPEQSHPDLAVEALDFHRLFYGVAPSGPDFGSMIGNAM